MKHYYSFLVLSLFVFLSLVCPSPVMAECTNTKTIQCEDETIYRINSSLLTKGTPTPTYGTSHSYYSGADGDYVDFKGTAGEHYYMVHLPAATYSFTVYKAHAGNSWLNIWVAGLGDALTYDGVDYGKHHGDGYDIRGDDQGYQDKPIHNSTVSNITLAEGDYIIGLYGNDWAAFDKIVIVADGEVFCEEPSCTAPDHVEISGNWDYFVGETISLSAQAYSSAGTGSPIAEGNITGYQWKHNGVDIDGATSKTYSLTTTSPSDGGDYSCVVSTGATCSAEGVIGTKVYALQCYTDGETTYNFTRVGTSKVGTVEVPLTSGQKQFKIYAGASQYYGNNTSAVFSDISNYEFKGDEGNFKLEAGLGGTFTFTIDYTDNGGAPKVSVTYPRKTIYLTPGVWDKDGAKFAIYYFISDAVKGWTDFMTANDCGMSAEIPLWNGVKMIAARINGSLDAPAFGDGNCYNQTSDITVESSKDYISITGWGASDYTYGTFSPTTYTISFAGNGNSGGSMSNVTAIPCGEDRTLVANGFTKTGHSFTNWIANVDVKINGETVTAGSSISNEATIQDITQNITLTAQWAPKTTSVTLNANTAYHGSTSSSVTATWGTALPVFEAATGESGYALTGYFTDPTGGTKIINADGTLAASTTYTTADSKWNSELSALTLYPQYSYRNIITTGAVGLFDSYQGSGGSASYTCSSVADPECHFDHNVFCFEYSNMGGNSSNYYGCRLTGGPAYTPNAAATGFAFWYRTESSSDPVYMEFAGKVYKLAATNRAWHYAYLASSRASTKSGEFDIWINGEKDGFSTTQSSGKIYLSELQATNVTSADPIAPATTHTITVASNNITYGTVSSTPASGSSVTDCASITVTATPESGCSFVEWKKGDTQVSTEASYTFTMSDHNAGSDLTLTAYFQQDEFTISSLPWEGSQDLTGQAVVSAEAISSCFDSEITFTFTGTGTVNYYDNDDRETLLGTVTSGMAITLTDDLRAHGIYIMCTSGTATLTAVSKTTIGSVYQIWSGNVAVDDWLQQVVLGPEHFQTAIVGDVLRVITASESDGAQGALQYIYTDGDSHTYKGLDNSDSGGLRDWDLTSGEKERHYFEITINAIHLANLKRYGVIVKGSNYTIQRVELRASCSNQAMRTTAPDVTIRGADGSIDIMDNKLEFADEGFNLGNWEHKVELHKNCFKSVEVGSLINFYMREQEGTTISFRCNVDSIHAESYKEDPPRCPSYGDISFDRTIHNLYGDEPQLIGQNKGYRVLSLLVDEDMLTRLKETGMILCGKGAFIKIVEGVPNPFVVKSGEEKEIPTVVNNLEIYQGGEAANEEDIQVLGNITYFRPAKGGYLNNKLNTWYTFTLPFEVSDVEVYDEAETQWYDINAVYYSNDETNQETNDPNGKGHYYLQYLSKQDIASDREAFITRWQYITPGHSDSVYAYESKRYGYPKKNEAYIILFDSVKPAELSGYWNSNPTIRFVGGPQTIAGRDSLRTVVSDGYEYWMYANNTLHSFTYPGDVYILNEEGTYFILHSNPTIRPFECYVQATASLKAKYAALPMRGFRIDNTTTGAESIQGSAIRAEKILRNGQLIIIRNGVEYDATGVVIR